MDVEKSKLIDAINKYNGSTIAELSNKTGINKKRVIKLVKSISVDGYILHDNKVTHCHL